MRILQAVALVIQQGCTCDLTVGPGGQFTIKHLMTGFEKSIPLVTFEKQNESQFRAALQKICPATQG